MEVKKMKKIYAGILATFAIALLGVGMVSAFGGFGKGMFNPNLTEEEKAEMQEFHDVIQTAVENNDYDTWKSLKESKLTEEQFEKVKERHQMREEFRTVMEEARESGDFSAMQELKGEFGMPGKEFRKGIGFRFGQASCGMNPSK